MTKIKFEMESDKQIDKVMINLIKGKEIVQTETVPTEKVVEPEKPAIKVVKKHRGFDPNMMDIVNS